MADARTCISAAPVATLAPLAPVVTLAPLAPLTLQMLQFIRTYNLLQNFRYSFDYQKNSNIVRFLLDNQEF